MNTVVSIDKSRGFTRMDNEVLEALIGADLSAREYKVALAIHRLTAGYNTPSVKVAALYLSKMMYGDDTKAEAERANVSRAVNSLIRQRVLFRAGGSRDPIGFAPVSEWKIDPKSTVLKSTQSVEKHTATVLEITHIKERNTNTTSNEVVVAAAAENRPKQVRSEPVPFQAIADLFNTTCVDLPKVALLTDARKSAIRARWKQNPIHRDLDFWADYFSTVQASAFLTGKVPDRNGGKSFRANFDWVMAPTNFAKVVEGNYHA